MPTLSVSDLFSWNSSPITLPEGISASEAVSLLEVSFASAPIPVLMTIPIRESSTDCPIIAYVNPAFCSSTGYQPYELIGESIQRLRGPNSDPNVQADLQRELANGMGAEAEDINYRKNGTEYTVRWSVVPVLDTQGQPVRDLSFQSHTDRVRGSAVVESGNLLELLFHSNGAGICLINDARRFVRVNPACTTIFGYSEAELLASDFLKMMRESDRDRAARCFDDFLAGRGEAVSEYTIFRKTGDPRRIMIHAERLTRRTGQRFQVCTITDITERYRAEKQLHERERLVRSLFDVAPVGIIITDMHGRITDANSALLQMLNRSWQEVNNSSFFAYTHSDSKTSERLEIDRLKSGEVEQVVLQKFLHRHDDATVLVEQHTRCLRSPQKQQVSLIHVLADITSRESALQQLRENESILRRVTAAVPGAVYRYTVRKDGADHFTFLSAGAANLFQIPIEEMLADARKLFARIQPLDQGAALNSREFVVANNLAQTTHRLRLPDGTDRWIYDQSQAEPIAADGSRTWNGTFTDVTTLKEAKDKYQAQLEQLRAIGDNLPDGIVFRVEVKQDGTVRFVYLSKGVRTVLGISGRELLEDLRLLSMVLIAEDQQLLEEAIRQAATSGESFSVELGVKSRNHELRWTHWRGRATPQADGQTYVDGLVLDITDRKRSEAKVAKVNNLLQSVIDAYPGPISVKDTKHRYVLMNAYQAKLYGASPANAIGRTAGELISPEYGEYSHQRDRQTMLEKRTLTYEEETPDATGAVRSWWTTKTPWVESDRGGEIVRGTINISTDISALKKTQEQQQRLQNHLMELARYESISLLAGGVAHDFNNLMTTVLGYAELAQETLSKNHPLNEHLSAITVAANHATGVCRQLMGLAGQQRQPKQPVDLGIVTQEIVTLCRSVTPKTVTLEFVSPPSLPLILADPAQVGQMLMNLITNGFQAMGDNRGTIRIAVQVLDLDDEMLDSACFAETAAIGRFVEIQVVDSGSGIPESSMDKIFEPYYTTKQTGHGLGLAAVRGIMRTLNGVIRVESEVGRGSTFSLCFPVQRTLPQPPRQTTIRLPEMRTRGGKLLVVTNTLRESVIEATLKTAGFQVEVIAELNRARQLAQSGGFEGVVLDLDSTEQLVLQMIEVLHPRVTMRPTIVLTTQLTPAMRARIDDDSRVKLISKPFLPSQLLYAIDASFAEI